MIQYVLLSRVSVEWHADLFHFLSSRANVSGTLNAQLKGRHDVLRSWIEYHLTITGHLSPFSSERSKPSNYGRRRSTLRVAGQLIDNTAPEELIALTLAKVR